MATLFVVLFALLAQPDTAAWEMSDTLRRVVVTKDGRLPIPVHVEKQPATKSLSDILGPGLTDKIMHPFDFKRRKRQRHRAKMIKALEEYDRVRTPNELLIEALRREGIDPDSLLQHRPQ